MDITLHAWARAMLFLWDGPRGAGNDRGAPMPVITGAVACDDCDAPCAAVCAPHAAAGHPATAPAALVRLAAGGPHPLLQWCSHCGACEAWCPHDMPVRALLRPQLSAPDYARVLQSWTATAPWRAHSVLWAGCDTHRLAIDVDALARALHRHGVQDVAVARTLPCGGDGDARDEVLAAQISSLHRGVREIVVPSGACRDAMIRRFKAAGLRGRTVAVLDQWLARFGVSISPNAAHFSCCRLRRDARDIESEASAVWPAGPTCCGAGLPLQRAAPHVASATAAALLARWQDAGTEAVHVEDAACAAHLRAVAKERGLGVRIVTRLDVFLAAGAAAISAASTPAGRPR